MSNETTFNPFSLIIGILSVLASLLIMKNPFGTVLSLSYLIATISIIEGIIKWQEVRAIDQIATISHSVWYISIAIDILFGVLILISPVVGVTMIWFMFAFLVIFNSLVEMWINQFLDVDHSGHYWLNLVLSGLGLIAGVVLLFNPILAISTTLFILSFAFMFFGITKIARSF